MCYGGGRVRLRFQWWRKEKVCNEMVDIGILFVDDRVKRLGMVVIRG